MIRLPILFTPGDLTFDRDGNLEVSFVVKGENFGKSIAQDIRVYWKLFGQGKDIDFVEIPKWQGQVCDHPKNIEIRPGITFFQGFDRFPGKTFEYGIGNTLTKAEIERASHYYTDEPLGPRYFDRLYLVGCVDYRSSFTETRHQTRFAYVINKSIDLRDDIPDRTHERMHLMEFKVGVNLPVDGYLLFPSMSGGNYTK